MGLGASRRLLILCVYGGLVGVLGWRVGLDGVGIGIDVT